MSLIDYYKDWKRRNLKNPKNNRILILLGIVAAILIVSTISGLIPGVLTINWAKHFPRNKVFGEYKVKKGGNTYFLVLLYDDLYEFFKDGKKLQKGKWREVISADKLTPDISKRLKMENLNTPIIIEGGELHVESDSGDTAVYRTNKDGSITHIAGINEDGKRKDVSKEEQLTFKNIR